MWVLVCARVLTGSLHPRTLQLSCPERQAAPFGPLDAVRFLRDSLPHPLLLAGFSTPGKDRTEMGWPLVSRDQPFFSHNIPLAAHSQCLGLSVKTQA